MLKEQKGITLVALIITIIVMLILAGVSISLVVGENGVLTQAQSVEPKQVAGALKEAVSLANADIMSTYYGDTTAGKTNSVKTEKAIVDKIIANYSYQGKYQITASTDTNTINADKTITLTLPATFDLDPDTTGVQNTMNVTVDYEANKPISIKVQ